MATNLLPEPWLLHKGCGYRARVIIPSGIACAFLSGLTEGLRTRLEDAGFVSVQVFAKASDLPADWPADQKKQSITQGGCTLFVQGVWGAPTTTVDPKLLEQKVEIPMASFTPTVPAVWHEPGISQFDCEIGPGGGGGEQPPGGGGGDIGPRKTCTSSAAAPVAKEAWKLEGLGKLNDAALQAVLAIARFEGGFGCANFRGPDGQDIANDNNWGAVHCPLGPEGKGQRTTPKPGELWTHCVSASDTQDGKDATRFAVAFRGYPTPISGARDMLRILRSVAPKFRSGDAMAIAKAMKPVYRYGVSVEQYAEAIAINAKEVAAKLGQPLKVFLPREVTKQNRGPLLLVGAVAGVTALGVGGWYLYERFA